MSAPPSPSPSPSPPSPGAPTLARSVVEPDHGPARSYVLFLHGILGTGGNLRGVAKRMLAGDDRGAVLVDLRQHGRSQGFPAPHTVAAAAADLDAIASEFPLSGVVAHSFGGKVALSFLARCPSIRDAYILDSTPGPRPDARGSETTLSVLAALDSVPSQLPGRDAFVEHLLARGLSRDITAWLAMNVVHVPGTNEVRFGLDLPTIHALIDDYFARDLWPEIASPPPETRLTFVAGGKSDVLSADDLRRLSALAEARPDHVRLRTLPSAGHWVHVDDPDGLVAALREPWPSPAG